MAGEHSETTNSKTPLTVNDDQITTQQNLPRRSFLNRTGAMLAGAAGIVAGMRASASPQSDPDQKRASDPDQKRANDPDQKKASDPDQKKASDPDQRKASDPDQKKASDPDQKKAGDPDQKKASDPDKGNRRL